MDIEDIANMPTIESPKKKPQAALGKHLKSNKVRKVIET